MTHAVRESVLTSHTRPVPDAGDPLLALDAGGFTWLNRGAGFATSGVAARIPVPGGPNRLERAAERAAAVLGAIMVDDPLGLAATGPIAVGALPFFEHVDGELVVPAVVVGRTRGGTGWITRTGPAQSGPPADDGQLQPGDEPSRFLVDTGGGLREWTAAVERALGHIADGELAKVVLARQVGVEADRPFQPARILDRLRQSHPTCFTYSAGGFMGASPELLVRRRGSRVLSRPMAGSAGRGATEADDERLLAALASSSKELAEHALVVDQVRSGLDPLCCELCSGGRPDVVRLATVAHLATTVAGRLRAPAPSALAVAARLHPTPAVAGMPRAAALAAIAELEGFERGLYAGPVGWVDARGDGDWAVALRCARLSGRRAWLAAGAGIVADSEPQAEWAETQAKLDPMLRALVRP